jgi:hypothetical protein
MISQKGFKNSLLGVFIYSITAVVVFLLTHVGPVWSDSADRYKFKQSAHRVYVCWEDHNYYYYYYEIQKKINNVKEIINNSWGAHSTLEFEGWESCQYNPKIRQIKIIFNSRSLENAKVSSSLPASMHRWPKGGYNSKTNTITLRGDESNRIYMTLFGLALGFAPEARRPDVFRDKLTEGEKDEGICTQINKPLPVYDPENHFIQDKDFRFKRLNYKEWQKQAYNPYSVMNACISDKEYKAIVEREKGGLLSRDDIQMLHKAFGDNISKGYAYEYNITDLKLDPVGAAVINDSVYTAHYGYFENQMPQMTIPKNSKITFNASVPEGGSAVVSFHFEANRFQYIDTSFNNVKVKVSGVDTETYTVDVPTQGAKVFDLFLMYINKPNVGVKITDISIKPFSRMRNKHLINKKSDLLTGFYKLDDRKYQFYKNGVQLNLEDALLVDNDINALYKNDYFVFTYTKDGEGKPESFLFKKKENSRTLLPVDDPLLICDLDHDPFVLTDPNARKQKQLFNQIKYKFSDIHIIRGLLEELNSQEKQLLESGKIWGANCKVPRSSDQDQGYDIFYHDDLYGHMGEVITLFCNKTKGQIAGQYTFVDLNPKAMRQSCVNFKEYLDQFAAQKSMVFFRGNGFNGRLYGLPNSYFENGNYNFDTFEFVSPKEEEDKAPQQSGWKFTDYNNDMAPPLDISEWDKPEHSEDEATPTGSVLARKDSINNFIPIYFTGTIDPDVNAKNMQFGNSLEVIEPGYYINGIKASLYEEVIETAPVPFDSFVRQNVTYAFIGDHLFRNGIPFTGELPEVFTPFNGEYGGRTYIMGQDVQQ